MVRDDAQADVVSARGAKPHVVDLHDRPAVAAVLRGADGAIHTASPGDTTSAALDAAVVDAAIDALAGTGKALPAAGPTGAGRAAAWLAGRVA